MVSGIGVGPIQPQESLHGGNAGRGKAISRTSQDFGPTMEDTLSHKVVSSSTFQSSGFTCIDCRWNIKGPSEFSTIIMAEAFWHKTHPEEEYLREECLQYIEREEN